MRKILLLLGLLGIAAACTKVDDDTGIVCTSDCTRIEGRVFTADNQPIKNAKLIFRHRTHTGPNSNVYRIIGDDRTDADGRYSMDVYLEDGELLPGSGTFELYIKGSTLPGSVFVAYDFSLWDSFIEIGQRDTLLVKHFYAPKRKTVTVNLEGFTPQAPGDQFQLQYYHPVGFESDVANSFGNFHNYQLSGINAHMVTGNSKSFTINLADKEYNVLQIVRIKNGIYSEQQVPILLDSGSPTTFTYQY